MAMTAVIIDGRWIAENIRLGVKYAVEELSSQTGVVPGLAVVLVSDDPASGRYVAAKEKAAAGVGHLLPDLQAARQHNRGRTAQEDRSAELGR